MLKLWKTMRMEQKLKGSIFIDSGAHSLYTEHVIKKNHTEGYSFYETDKFWDYVDKYAEWIKKNLHKINIYVNVDVIFNPKLSWKVQKYLENQHGLKPLPVIHYNTDIKWLKKYMDDYEYIGIGGIGQEVSVSKYTSFGDKVFSTICDSKGIPQYKLHGFAITSPSLIHRYPWYSVDSTSWVQYGRFGAICIPKIKNNKFNFSIPPIVLFVSKRSPSKNIQGKHISTISSYERKCVFKYIKDKGFSIGKSKTKKVKLNYIPKEDEIIIEKNSSYYIVEKIIKNGVANNNVMRDTFNAMYFIDMANSVPEWPWPFKHRKIGFL